MKEDKAEGTVEFQIKYDVYYYIILDDFCDSRTRHAKYNEIIFFGNYVCTFEVINMYELVCVYN